MDKVRRMSRHISFRLLTKHPLASPIVEILITFHALYHRYYRSQLRSSYVLLTLYMWSETWEGQLPARQPMRKRWPSFQIKTYFTSNIACHFWTDDPTSPFISKKKILPESRLPIIITNNIQLKMAMQSKAWIRYLFICFICAYLYWALFEQKIWNIGTF